MTGFNDHCWKDVVDEEILEIYAAYQRETYVGPAPAVLAIISIATPMAAGIFRSARPIARIPVPAASMPGRRSNRRSDY